MRKIHLTNGKITVNIDFAGCLPLISRGRAPKPSFLWGCPPQYLLGAEPRSPFFLGAPRPEPSERGSRNPLFTPCAKGSAFGNRLLGDVNSPHGGGKCESPIKVSL